MVVGGGLAIADFFVPWFSVVDAGHSDLWSILGDLELRNSEGLLLMEFPYLLVWLLPLILVVGATATGIIALIRAPGKWLGAPAIVVALIYLLWYLYSGADLFIVRIATVLMLLGAIMLALKSDPAPVATRSLAPAPAGAGLSSRQIAMLVVIAGVLMIVVGYVIPWDTERSGDLVHMDGWGVLFFITENADLQTTIATGAAATLPLQAALIALVLGVVASLGRARVTLAACAVVVAAVTAALSLRLDRNINTLAYGWPVMLVGFLVLVSGALVLLWIAVTERGTPAPAIGAA